MQYIKSTIVVHASVLLRRRRVHYFLFLLPGCRHHAGASSLSYFFTKTLNQTSCGGVAPSPHIAKRSPHMGAQLVEPPFARAIQRMPRPRTRTHGECHEAMPTPPEPLPPTERLIFTLEHVAESPRPHSYSPSAS